MDRRLLGFVAVLVLLVLCNAVWADQHRMGPPRYRSDAEGYVRHDYARRYRGRWLSVADFRTRRHHISDPTVGIDRRVSAIQLQGVKCTAYVRRAFMETRRGRLIHVPELEGRLSAGQTRTVRLNGRRYVRNLVLEVASKRHKRAYIRVNVRSDRKAHAPRRYKYRNWNYR
jgi:hypothetical protein